MLDMDGGYFAKGVIAGNLWAACGKYTASLGFIAVRLLNAMAQDAGVHILLGYFGEDFHSVCCGLINNVLYEGVLRSKMIVEWTVRKAGRLHNVAD